MPNSIPPNNHFPPNIEPNTFSLLGVFIGAILVGDMTAAEQNSVGNWFELVGQYILTCAAQQQLIESRSQKQNNKMNSFADSVHKSNQHQDEIEFILQKMQKIEEELQKLKNSNS